MSDQLYADTLLELEKALAGWNDASVIAEELLRQRDEALQLARELRDALEDALSGGLEGPTKQAYDDGFLIISKANQLLKQQCN